MSNVYVNGIGVPRIARNKRIYSGNNAVDQTTNIGGTVIDWATVTPDLIELLRSVHVDGDLTVQNLGGNAGDIVFVDDSGTMGTVHFVDREIPSGDIDNVNDTFVLANIPISGSVRIFKNGQKLDPDRDYSITDDTITLNVPPQTDAYYTDLIICEYRYVTYGTTGTAASNVAYTAMTKGAACVSAGFDMAASRINKTITLTGTFTTTVSPSTGSVIASIPLATIASGMTLTNRIYGMATAVDTLDANRGVRFYVETFTPSDTDLEIIVLNSRDNVDAAITLTFNVI